MSKNNLPSTGVRPDPSYGNPLDQFRYIYTLDLVSGKQVLDLASGVGWGSFLMSSAGASVIGIDVSQEAIDFSREYYSHSKVRFEKRDSSTLNELDMVFDIITCFETIEHVHNPYIFLQELRSVSHHNTRLFLSTPNSILFGSDKVKPSNPYHLKEYNREEIVSLAQSSGWEVVEYLGQYPVPSQSIKIKQYQSFITNYWRRKKLRRQFGVLYSVFNRLSAPSLYNLKDPAHDSPHVQPVPDNHEAAYHYMILAPKKNNLQ